MLKRVYVEQFHGWWSFTCHEWMQFVSNAISDEDYRSLPEKNEINGIPCCARKDRGENSYWSNTHAARIVQPLDWTVEEWQDELKKMEKLNTIPED